MARIVRPVSAILRAAIPGALIVWVVLFAFLVVYANPPLTVILLLLLPILPLAWLTQLAAGENWWEVDALGLRTGLGERVRFEIRWRDVRSLRAIGDPRSRLAMLSIVDNVGRGRRVRSGTPFDFDDIKWLYEAAAHYLAEYDVTARNNLGWEPRLRNDLPRPAGKQGPKVLLHVAMSTAAAGVLIVATGSYVGQSVSVVYGIGLIVVGATLAVLNYIRVRRLRNIPGANGALK